MGVAFILVISISVQFAAAILALRLIRITGKRVAWALIAAALFFMAIRRCITLFQAEILGVPYTTSMSAELVALVISILMLTGVIWIAPLLRSLKHSEEELRKAYDELELRNTQLKRENEMRLRTEETLKLEEARLEAILQLSQMSEASTEEIAAFTLEGGIALTGSKIGFIGFLNEDESIYTLHAVSKAVVKECNVEGSPLHWPVADGGLWADAIRERRTLFINDYNQPNPSKKGFPAGHPSVDRLMVVPVFDDKRIVVVAGVGNKASDYDKSDERQIALLMSGMWSNVQKNLARRGLEEAREQLEQRVKERTRDLQDAYRDLNRAQMVAHTGSWRLDLHLNQLLWSDETYQIFGIPREMPMTYETFLSNVHPEDREYVDRKWSAGLQGEPYDIEHRIVVNDEVKWVRERAELEFDSRGKPKGGFGTVQDITERKRIENELRVKDFAVNSAASGIAIADLDGIVTYANLACLSMWDYQQEEEVIGKPIDNFFADKNRLSVAMETVLEEAVWQGEIKAQRSDESTFDVQVLANLVAGADGEPFCVMASFVDITERKKLDQLKDEFIGLVSHEMRTPLTVIHGCVSTVLTEWERLPVSEAQQLLQDAMLESESLSHLIENLMELSRAQAQQLALYPEGIDIQNLIRETITKVKRKDSSHQFVTSIPDGLQLINADPLRIERVLYNLLDNAAKYSPQSSQIKVSVSGEPERLVIGVSDRGKGLSSSEQARIFGLFQRLENSRPDRARGAGIGLMVCRRLVEAHGGEIWVESKKGRGSTFFFSLPFKKGKDASGVSSK